MPCMKSVRFILIRDDRRRVGILDVETGMVAPFGFQPIGAMSTRDLLISGALTPERNLLWVSRERFEGGF